jgi:methylenetetrahydrofolate--tRNA-(uracil-5-)-methyltransferase
MPIEIMAGRGPQTMLFGPLKPVGLTDPRSPEKPYAVIQLRRDNAAGTLFNMVGFQTHLKWGEQQRVFRLIPGLEKAEFVRYGTMHRNTFINSPKVLKPTTQLKGQPNILIAGQVSGVEGYVESAASGLLAGIETAREIKGLKPIDFSSETAIGALALYVSGGSVSDFQPMNINFGIISPLGVRAKGKRNKNLAISERSLQIIDGIQVGGNHE